ncbi:hypothetical protein NDK47_11785 [Brevibacillus ruminantium]|uniref:Uncharacterized protein n=1 Tax=Brevibacillus ruminantium TaxID=2950604 RepID=A0ABY4WLI7_9BACL|nr:hypothetical protein [Brevibacillus ruminantium]USG67908.1 hypothetical protein NDK47_11785 [Brevibacillus ruminantium]
MKEPFRDDLHERDEEDVAGLIQLVELINAKGDRGEIEELLEQSDSVEADGQSGWLRP